MLYAYMWIFVNNLARTIIGVPVMQIIIFVWGYEKLVDYRAANRIFY